MTSTNHDNLEGLLSGLYEKLTDMANNKRTIVDYMALDKQLSGIITTFNPEKIKEAVCRAFNMNGGAIERDYVLDKCIENTIGINTGPCPEAKLDLRNDYLIAILSLASKGKIVINYKNGKIELTSDNSDKFGTALEEYREYKRVKAIANKLVGTVLNPNNAIFGSVRSKNYSISADDLGIYTVEVMKENYQSTKDPSINKMELISGIINLAMSKDPSAKKEDVVNSAIEFVNDMAKTDIAHIKNGRLIPMKGFREALEDFYKS